MTVRADLDSLRTMIGAQGTADDGLLLICLETAGNAIYEQVHTVYIARSEVQYAVLLVAARLYKRRNSPEGVAGWDDSGAVRISSRDPDVERLIAPYVDAYHNMGIG